MRSRALRLRNVLRAAVALGLLFVAESAFAQVSARVSQDRVHVNEPFELILDSSDENGGSPDLSALRAKFAVLSQATSETMRVVNGHRSSRSELRLTLMAREAGDLSIPAIRFGSEETQPIPLKVLKASTEEVAQTSDRVFVEVSAEPTTALVQSQIVYTVRLYWASQLADLRQVAAPETEGPYTVTEPLGNARVYEQVVKGVRYRVSELRYALFPQTPGVLTIKPSTFTALELDQAQGGFNPYGYGAAPSGKPISASSESLQITVKPIPAKAPSKPWLPASNVQITEAWPTSEPELRVGEPTTRTLMVVAQGLPAAKLPALEPQYPKGLKTYSENPTLENRPTEKGLTGIRRERTTIVPTEDGRFRLPPIQLRWWNTALSRAESAEVPARSIRVLPALPGESTPTRPQAPAHGQQYPLMAPPAAPWSAMNEPPVEPQPLPASPGRKPRAEEEPSWLVWLSLVLGMGWLGTAATWWLSRRGARATPSSPEPSPARPAKPKPLPPALQALRTACEQGDRHAAQDALLTWGRQTWPAEAVTSLGILATLTTPPLTEEIQALDRSLYGAQGTLWSAQRLWDALRSFRPPQSDRPGISDEMMTPLNPSE